ncbi:MAG TPA: FGGY-family carbohydrate kinase, partial [Myxococcota bacterium]|nr:FGGY-family carbohydrate kinase [Myxococcota bacterium]
STKAHIARAVLEGMALQVVDMLRAMEADAGRPLAELRVDGGAARNNLLMQYQADVLEVRCVRPKNLESTAMGAAYLAGIGVGFWSSPEAVSDAWARDRGFEPSRPKAEVDQIMKHWSDAVRRA